MLVTISLRIFELLVVSIMATDDFQRRQDIINSFDAPPSAWGNPNDPSQPATPLFLHIGFVEILVLTYSMNSSINLQNTCGVLLAFSPPASLAIWLQVISRIVRFRQTRPCLIIQLYMAGTYNQRMVSHGINNYLATFAATISDVALTN